MAPGRIRAGVLDEFSRLFEADLKLEVYESTTGYSMKITSYWYHSVNFIIFGVAQNDHIKWLLMSYHIIKIFSQELLKCTCLTFKFNFTNICDAILLHKALTLVK